MATADEILDLLDLMREWYSQGNQRFNPSERASALWIDDLHDLSIQALFAAFQQHRNQNDWPPQPKHLRDIVRSLLTDDTPTPGEAWAEVTAMMRSVGASSWRGNSWQSVEGETAWQPVWSHPLIARTVAAMGGYDALCAADDPDGVMRGQWDRAYNALVNRVETEAKLLPQVKALRDNRRAAPPALSAPAPVEGFKTPAQVLRAIAPPRHEEAQNE